MRSKGKITNWNGEKGYGFITPNSGAKQVFVHISAFRDRCEPPLIGQLVEFTLSADNEGRPRAVRLTKEGERVPGEIKRNDRLLYLMVAVAFLVIVLLSVVTRALPPLVLLVYLGASLITYFMYYRDKAAAQTDAWRTPESTLHALSLVGGWPGL